jgi:predicted transcriptional regulator
MKSLSLKIEDSIINETDELIKDIKISRNQYINQAIAFYNNIKKKNKIEKQLRDSSKLVAKNSMEVLKEFEELEETFEYGD